MLKHIRLGIAALVGTLILAACQTPSGFGGSGASSSSGASRNTGPVTTVSNCEQRETDGYADKIRLVVNDNQVTELDWTASPRGGSCRFQLKNFSQVSVKPTADLQSKTDKKCHLYVWQDDSHITVAAYSCKKSCKLNDKVLPVLLDTKTGNCKAKDTITAAK